MKKRLIILTISGPFVIVSAMLYFHALREQHEAKAILTALADVKFGVTNKNDFIEHMARFNKYRSSKDPFGYSDGKSYQGVGYAVSNTILARYSIFPRTILAVSVYFDSNGTAHDWIVTIHNDSASVAIKDEANPPPGITADVIPGSDTVQWPERRVLHQIVPQDLKRVATSCLTSWFGCDTIAKLISGRN